MDPNTRCIIDRWLAYIYLAISHKGGGPPYVPAGFCHINSGGSERSQANRGV
jgi:hypothetical protein